MSRPTAASLLTEMQAHMLLLLLDPAPLEKAPAYFLDYWIQLLQRVQASLAPEA